MALKQHQLLQADLITGPADYVRAVYQVKIPARFTFDDLMLPEIWKNIERLRTGDMVIAMSGAGTFDVDLRVLSSDRGYTLMRPIRTWFAPDVETQAATEPHVAFSPGVGHLVYAADGSVISKHLSGDAANAALQDYLKGASDAPTA